MNSKIILIIPAYNEQASIQKTVDSIADIYDYIIINDGSTDRTADIIKNNKM